MRSPCRLAANAFICGVVVLFGAPAFGHKPSDSYLNIVSDGPDIHGQWDIALRDLDYALGLDTDGNGAITWGEVRLRHEEIAAYALSYLSIRADAGACESRIVDHLVDNHSDGAYAVLRFSASCPQSSAPMRISYRLFFDLDPQHKGLLSFTRDGRSHAAIFSPKHDTWRIEPGGGSGTQQFLTFFREGNRHIWTGFDHLLFLLSLLLPAVLVREQNRWQPVSTFRPAAIDVFKIVTAFTVAHSITLSLAALEVISLPSRWVESIIAASVALAALNNLYPVVSGRLWVIAFAFGLVHGVGFANVLADLGLPRSGLLRSLVAFNLGVETGQLAVVGVFLPFAYAIRHTWSYQVMTLRMGSALIVVAACVWLLERGAGFSFS